MKYCLFCKKLTENAEEPVLRPTRNRRTLAVTHCAECQRKKYYFVKNILLGGKGIVNKAIDILPVELHLPGYQYCGPGTKLQKRLERGDPGINQLDRGCKEHDIAYSQSSDVDRRHEADEILSKTAQSVRENPKSTWKEKLAATVVKKILDKKVKWGMGGKKKL